MIKLSYKTVDGWQKIPDWAEFFIGLGEFLSDEHLFNERIIVGVSIPTASFAAALSALGVVKKCQTNPFVGSNKEHFKNLCNLPKNTPVKCLVKGREKNARLLGKREINGNIGLDVQISEEKTNGIKCSSNRIVLEHQCDEIKLIDDVSIKDNHNLSRRKMGKKVYEVSPFVRNFLQSDIKNSFSNISSDDCLIVGNKNKLFKEFEEMTFGCSLNNSEIAEGTFQEILRIKQFFSSERPSHCEFFPSAARRKNIKRNFPQNIPITIFDGANGFLKLRDFCRDSHWIVLLDRTERNFFSAVEQLNNDFSYRESDEIPADFPLLPKGLEAMVFTEKL